MAATDSAREQVSPGHAEAMEHFDRWNHRELVDLTSLALNRCCDAWAPLKTLAGILETPGGPDELTSPVHAAYSLLHRQERRLEAEQAAALRDAIGTADPRAVIRACQKAGGGTRGPADPPGADFPSWRAVADCFRIGREFDERIAAVVGARASLLEAVASDLYARATDGIDDLGRIVCPEVEARRDPAAAEAETVSVLWPDLSITMEKGGGLFGTRSRFYQAEAALPGPLLDFAPAAMAWDDASAIREIGVAWLRKTLTA